jgi:transposase
MQVQLNLDSGEYEVIDDDGTILYADSWEKEAREWMADAVYAIQHSDGWFHRTSAGHVKRFSSKARAKAHIDTLPCNGYAVVRYS